MELHSQYALWKSPSNRRGRELFRGIALDALSIGSARKPFPSSPRVQFVYFHHVFVDEEEPLRRFLEYYSEHYKFISYSEAVSRLVNGTIDGVYMAFSSDDGFQNNLAAARIFKEFGISVCFFLNPMTIGMTDFHRISGFCSERLNARPAAFLNWTQVDQIQSAGHEIGSHGLSHLNFAELSKENVHHEIRESKLQLEAKCGPIQHFAYPYGSWVNFTKEAFQAVLAIGHLSCATAVRGSHMNTGPTDLKSNLILRDQIIWDWPLRHIDYFMRRNGAGSHQNCQAQNLLS